MIPFTVTCHERKGPVNIQDRLSISRENSVASFVDGHVENYLIRIRNQVHNTMDCPIGRVW